jgi:hypothetical protein
MRFRTAVRRRLPAVVALAFFLLVAAPAAASPIIDVLGFVASVTTPGTGGRLSLGGNVEYGDVDEQRGALSAGLVHRRPDWLIGLTVGGGLKRSDGAWVDRAHDEHLRLRLWPSRRWQPEALVQYAYSEPQRLQGRFVAGLGPRVVVVDHPRGSLAAAALPIFEEEHLTHDGLADDGRTESVFRLSAYLRGGWSGYSGRGIGGVVYVQPRLDRPADLRILANILLTLPIVGPLDLELSGGTRWDTAPPLATQRLSHTVNLGLQLEGFRSLRSGATGAD